MGASVQTRPFGRLGAVSALSFGGGGIGGVYGAVARDEAVATVRAAVDAGITLLDLAPSYGPGELTPEAEHVVGEAFDGRIPKGVRLTTKVVVDDAQPVESLAYAIRESLRGSLERLRVARIDLFFLHSYVRPTHVAARGAEVIDISRVRQFVRPTFEQLVGEGLIGHWGLTGVAHPDAICELLGDEPKPAVVQCVANALDAVGNMWPFKASEQPDNRRIRTEATRNDVAVMGIRALAAGALADSLDRAPDVSDPTLSDFRDALAFRELARTKGGSPAQLALRYALTLPDVATVTLGAKTRLELAECLAAEAAGPLTAAEIAEVDDSCSFHRRVCA
jgi:aryl-alcohol dehydrogenase-like predicted oxidoreductase